MTAQPRQRPARDYISPGQTWLEGVLAVEACTARSFDRHTHEEFGIGLMLDGAQDSASGRGPVRAMRGHVITVNPGEVHDGQPVGGVPRRWRMLYFRPEALAQAFHGSGQSTGSELAHPVLDHPATARAFLTLHAALTQGPASALAAECLLLETVSGLIGHQDGNTRPRMRSEAINPARRAIDEDPATEWRLEELSEFCGMSRFHFLRAFRSITGLPPHAYQIQKRLAAARQMILGGGSLAETAAACGFSDQSHLNRHFVRSFGYTPGLLAKAKSA